jgi:hypothetical protein
MKRNVFSNSNMSILVGALILAFSPGVFAETPSERILSLTDDIIAGKIELDQSMSPT